MDSLLNDLRFALRTLARNGGFALAAVVTLGLGIGATSMVFSMVNTALLRPFPFAQPNRLVQLTEFDRNNQYFALSYPNFVDYRAGVPGLTALAAYRRETFTVRGSVAAERILGGALSYNFFELLGVTPVLGRSFRKEEDVPNGERVVILGHGLWQRSFGGSRDVIGRVVTVEGEPHTVIGVMPPTFEYPERTELWLPLQRDPAAERGHRYLQSIGRLRDDATIEQVRQEADVVGTRLRQQFEATNKDWRVRVEPLQEATVRRVKPVLLVMLAAVVFVLLIACANVANLLLARAAGRDKEIAIRSALGASRLRLLQQLLTESALLGLGGGVLGILLASWWLDLIVAALPTGMPFWLRFEIDRTVLLFTLTVGVVTALGFGLAPALHSLRADLQSALKEGRGTSATRGKTRLRGALVAGQLALAMVLLAGGLLMMRSFLAMRRVDPGFTIEQITAVNLDLPGSRYEAADTRRVFYERLLERVAALPGIDAVGAVSDLPIDGAEQTGNFSVQGRRDEIEDAAHYMTVTPGYFEAIGITLQRGRFFTSGDQAQAQPVAIINQRLADLYFRDRAAIGQQIAIGSGNDVEWRTIVGVVRNINQSDINQISIGPDIYLPFAQQPGRRMSIVMRTAAPVQTVVPPVRREVEALDPNIPLFDVKSMAQVVREAVWDVKFTSWLFAAFALIALLLAAIGLYGVIAYSVTQRTQEIGLRVALGAHPSSVMKLILLQGARLAAVGIVLGLVGAFGMGQAMSGMLFGIRPSDPVTFLFVAFVLTAVALLASYIPARRALRVDPITALRME